MQAQTVVAVGGPAWWRRGLRCLDRDRATLVPSSSSTRGYRSRHEVREVCVRAGLCLSLRVGAGGVRFSARPCWWMRSCVRCPAPTGANRLQALAETFFCGNVRLLEQPSRETIHGVASPDLGHRRDAIPAHDMGRRGCATLARESGRRRRLDALVASRACGVG